MPWSLVLPILGAVPSLAVLVVFVRWLSHRLRRVDDFLGDWNGEPDRPGVPGHPGVMARLDGIERRVTAVEKQLHPNGGSTLADAVQRIERNTS